MNTHMTGLQDTHIPTCKSGHRGLRGFRTPPPPATVRRCCTTFHIHLVDNDLLWGWRESIYKIMEGIEGLTPLMEKFIRHDIDISTIFVLILLLKRGINSMLLD